jgi:hypothetical protein
MRVFRIRITFTSGAPLCFTGLFADGFEAHSQVRADYPEARSVSAIRLSGASK